MDNSAQVEYWNGKAGERWAEEAAQLDRMLSPFIQAVIDAADISSSERVLDVGCGGGALSLAALDAGAGHVTGLDVSAPLLGLARQRAADRTDAEFIETDASEWQAGTSYDRLVSRFGVMFFEDPEAAFRNLHGQLKPGGRLAFACWQPLSLNEWAMFPLRVVMPLLDEAPELPEPGTPGPFAFENADRTLSILSKAGWKSPLAEAWTGKMMLPGSSVQDTAQFMMKIGPIARLAAEQDLDPELVRQHLEAALSEQVDDKGQVQLPAAVWIVTATA